MKLKIFSTIGDKYVESFTGIIKKMKSHPEYNDKGIDRCLPSMLRRVSIAGGEPDKVFQAAIDEAKDMYEAAEIYISPDDFTFVKNPDTPNYFQLYPNKEEVIRIKPKGRRELPQRVAAGDKLSSTLNDYGVWIFYTNVVLLKSLSLEMITDETLKAEPVNKDHNGNAVSSNNNLFLPSELTNSINMVSRANNKPIGAVNWIRAIKDIGPIMNDAGEIAKIRAITAIGNLWKTRVTTLHEILGIFAPFHLKGLDLGCQALKVTMLSTTCRGLRSEFHFPRDDKDLSERPVWDSQEFYHGRSSPSPPPPQQSLLTRLLRFFTKPPPQLPDNIKDAVDEAMKDDESVVTSLQRRLQRPRSRSPLRSKSKSRSRSLSAPRSRTKRGGAKRKNSKHTQRRRLRLRTRTRH
jgi:hypothetical protein